MSLWRVLDGYAVTIVRIPDADGGGYMATIPELGEMAYVGDGETEQEAYENLMQCKRDIERAIQENEEA